MLSSYSELLELFSSSTKCLSFSGCSIGDVSLIVVFNFLKAVSV